MDYQLYPIRKSDIDLPLYLMVKAMMVMRSVRNYRHYEQEFPEEEQLPMRESAMKYEHYAIYLVFPAHHPQYRLFPPEVASQRVIIALYKTPKSYGLAFEDAYRFAGFLDSNLTFHECKYGKVPMPAFPDASIQLSDAISPILTCLEEHHMIVHDWYKRLSDVQTMIANRVEGLHILHNAGFFDQATLWKLLSSSGISQQTVEALKAQMEDALTAFAMSVINASWKSTPVEAPAEKFIIKTVVEKKQEEPEKPIERERQPRNDAANAYLQQLEIEREAAELKAKQQKESEERRSEEENQRKQENNSRIIKRVLIFVAFVVVFFLGVWFTQYILIGTVVATGSVISVLVAAKVRTITENYEYTHPLGFRALLLFVGMLCPFFLMFPCIELGTFLHHATHGAVGPGSLFFFVLFVMVPLFLWAWMRRRKVNGDKPARPYSFLMALTFAICAGQLLGTVVAADRIRNEEWQMEKNKTQTEITMENEI